MLSHVDSDRLHFIKRNASVEAGSRDAAVLLRMAAREVHEHAQRCLGSMDWLND